MLFGHDLSIVECCSVLQCVAVCCSVLQCVAVCCSVLHSVAACCSVVHCECRGPKFGTYSDGGF